jgi:hypothetical protein
MRIGHQMGAGYDGVIFATNRMTAIKSFLREPLYQNERDVYIRIEDRNFHSAAGFAVPHLIGLDDDLWIVEMEILSPPFVVDFAGAYLDRKPPFTEEQWEEWLVEKREQFEDDWERIPPVMSAFRSIGVYLNDVKPGNITVR